MGKGPKTHSGTKSRVKITKGGKKGGKLLIGRSGTNHLQLKQTSRGKRAKQHANVLSGRNLKNIKRLLGV